MENKTTRKSVFGGTLLLEWYVDPHVDKDPKGGRTISLWSQSTWQWPRVILKNCLGFLTGKRCQIVLRCDWSRARAFCHRQGVQSTPYILRIAMAARSGAARRLGSQAGEYMAKHRGSKYQDPIQKENPVSTEPYGICWHPQRLRSSGWSGKTWGRAWNVRLWKGSLQAMYKMFRVLMVQSLLEEGTASPAQGLGSQGTEPPVLITVVANLVFRKNLPDEEDGRTRETGGGRESHPSGMGWDNWTRLEILESGNARLQEQAALAEENPQRVRSELACTPAHGPAPRTRNFRTDDGSPDKHARITREDHPGGSGKRNWIFDPRGIGWRRTRRAKWPGFGLVSWKRRGWRIWG